MDTINQKGQHAILYGERGVGKTSLANVLKSFLAQPAPPVACPRINCDGNDTFESVWRKVFDEIELLGKTRSMRFVGQDNLFPIKSSDLLDQGPVTPDSVRRVLTLLSAGSLPILIIDEFDRLPPSERVPFADTIKTRATRCCGNRVSLVSQIASIGPDHQWFSGRWFSYAAHVRQRNR